MKDSGVFRFRQFSVSHERATMKVSTDAVLLGAWVDIEKATHILDVGTGSGIIALMAAQRSRGRIHAIDPDEASVTEAAENFARSPWHERLKARQSSIQSWEADGPYDHILSNPPYFLHQLPSVCHRRNLARHAQELTPSVLASHIARMLMPKGQASMVCRASVFPAFQEGMNAFGYHLHRLCRVRNTENAATKLILATYSRLIPEDIQKEELVLTDEKGGRSVAYRTLTHEFYV